MDEPRTMKVGAVAEAAGLTVRTLHHWDRIGLLSPGERSPAGHREYTEADLVRLYQVLALRSLGLGLESIAVCLDAGVDPARLVRDHLAEVEAAAAELERLQANLRPLAEALDAGQVPDVAALLEVEWPELYRRVERLRAAGTAPDDRRVRRLVARTDELGARFSGGDREISAGVRAAWDDDPAGLSNVPAEQATTWRSSPGTWTSPAGGPTPRRRAMPDKPPVPRSPVAAASAAVPLLCTVTYAVVAAFGDAPWSVVPALLVATAVYGVLARYRLRRVARQH